MTVFDPNAAATENSGIFGLPYTGEESALVYLPVPWEATTSYGGGTSLGPQAIFLASHQVDLFDAEVEKPYEAGLFWLEESAEIRALNKRAKARAQLVIKAGGIAESRPETLTAANEVNACGEKLNHLVYTQTKHWLSCAKTVAVVGGDHSVPFGALKAVAEKHPSFGILHFDAHLDTRIAYEGFRWSHASIMFNVLEHIPEVKRLVQIGIRDFCEQELQYCESQGDRVKIFFDYELSRREFEGIPWAKTSAAVVEALPEKVWVSFDIDGLDPRFCPGTGTPVPGGIDFRQANYMLRTLVESGRQILGFDLNEVAPSPDGTSEWDANVGARLLYKLSAWTLASQKRARLRT